ncbi:ribonuclease HI [Arcobacter sp. FWKO B]|uniref:ribonuclease HI n=1 Tax=Arcobacter sp. FWKO B TaxID=2593672 RepID=UPI0018A64E60|nr:ribonuclease HI [Arcobacter sp. FWKO B]QOG11777.1 ribonuclease HI [Arcobacter sp. FWKO B]
MKKIFLYSDGSSLGNPGPGGYGTILKYKDSHKILSGGKKETTNNQMELLGVIEGLRALKEPCEVEIISDSKYVTQGINEWLANWQKNGFRTADKKPIKNLELWKEYIDVSKQHKINASWVKGHNGHTENEECDKIARDIALKFQME